MAMRTRSWMFALLLASLTPVVTTRPAQAQPQNPTARESRDAQRFFADGEQAYRTGNYESAVASWTAAYELDPRPRIRYNLSQAFERLGRLEEAIATLDGFVRDGSPDDPLFGEANARLSALRQRLTLTGVRILDAPVGAQIFVDSQPWGATPRPDRIPVSPGSHAIALVAPDGTRRDIAVVVPAGQVVDVRAPGGTETEPVIVFQDPSGASSGASPPSRDARSMGVFGPSRASEPSEPSEPEHRGPALLVAGIATAGVGAALLSYGIGRQASLSGCSDAGYTCLHESTVARQRSLGLALGSVLVAGGVTLVVVDRRAARAEDSARIEVGIGVASVSIRATR